MTNMTDDPTREIALEVRRYLDVHPDAADTAEGILRWWLPARYADASRRTIEAALQLLVAEHAVTRWRIADGSTLYGRCPRNGHGTDH
jgi:hypothetical protein